MSLGGEACHHYEQGNSYHEATLNSNVDLHLQNHDHAHNFYSSSHTMEAKPHVPFLSPDHLPSAITQDPFALGLMTSPYIDLETLDSNPMEEVPTSVWPRQQSSMCSIPGYTQRCFHKDKQNLKNQNSITAKATSSTPVLKHSSKPLKHTSIKYHCEWKGCNYSGHFASEHTLMRHISSVHISPNKFECVFCGKMFSRKDRYRAHVQLVHSVKQII